MRSTPRDCARNPLELRAEGHALIARGHAALAEADRLEASQARAPSDAGWIPIARSPLAKKTTRALVRSKAIDAKKIRGRIYLSVASLESYMRERETTSPANDEDALRAELGIERAS